MAGGRSVRGAGVWLGVVLPVFIVLVLIVPAVPTLGSHPVNSSASHEAKGAARVTSIPEAQQQAPAVTPSVAYTLDLCTNHLYSGNALPTGCSGPNPMGVAYDSGQGEVFVVNQGSSNVSVISDASNSVVATIPVVGDGGMAYDSGKGEVFVTAGNSVSVISDASNSVVATIPVGTEPAGVAYDSGKGEVFVANSNCLSYPACGQGSVSVISDASNSVVATIPVGTNPLGVAYDSGRGEVFVTNALSNTVSVISDANNSVVATIPVGTNPWGVAYDSGKGEMFVTNSYSNSVSVISDASNNVVANIPIGTGSVGTGSYGVAYDSGKGEVFVTNYYLNNVSVISDASNSVVTTILVGSYPRGVAYDLSNGYVYVSNQGQGTISIITTGPAPSTYPVSFSETGLPTGTSWSVTLNGAMKSGTGSIVFTEPNGSYSFSVGVVSGYIASLTSGTFTVSGAAVSKGITFTALPPGQYSVVFSETGLPTGTNWSVMVGSTTHTSTGSTISFAEVNGTYPYTIGAVAGYTANPASGSVKVIGTAASQSITFTSSTSSGKTNPTIGFLGFSGYDGYFLLIVIAALVVAVVVIALTRRRKAKLAPPPPVGYQGYPQQPPPPPPSTGYSGYPQQPPPPPRQ